MIKNFCLDQAFNLFGGVFGVYSERPGIIDSSDAIHNWIDDIVLDIIKNLPIREQLVIVPLVCKQFYVITSSKQIACQEMFNEVHHFILSQRSTNTWPNFIAEAILMTSKETELFSMSLPTQKEHLEGGNKSRKIFSCSLFAKDEPADPDHNKAQNKIEEVLKGQLNKYVSINLKEHIDYFCNHAKNGGNFSLIEHKHTKFQCEELNGELLSLSPSSIALVQGLKNIGQSADLKEILDPIVTLESLAVIFQGIILPLYKKAQPAEAEDFERFMKEAEKEMASEKGKRQVGDTVEWLKCFINPFVEDKSIATIKELLEVIIEATAGELAGEKADDKALQAFNRMTQMAVKVWPLLPTVADAIDINLNSENSFCFLQPTMVSVEQGIVMSTIGSGKLELVHAADLNPECTWIAQKVLLKINANQ